MDFKPLCVLVTGSSGFIGTHVVRHLCNAGHRVIGYDLIPPEDRFPDGSIYLCGDIRTERLPHEGIDAVVHLAALAGVRPSMDRPFDYLSTNVTGTLRLLEHCRIRGIPHFVFASSSSVYGPDTPLPAEESATPDPCSSLRRDQAPDREAPRPALPRPAVLLGLGFLRTSKNASAPIWHWKHFVAGSSTASRSSSTATAASAATSPSSRMWPGRSNWPSAGPVPARPS